MMMSMYLYTIPVNVLWWRWPYIIGLNSNWFLEMTILSTTLTFFVFMCYNWICIVNYVTSCWQTLQNELVTIFGGWKVQTGNKNNERHVSVFWNCKSVLIFDIYLTSKIEEAISVTQSKIYLTNQWVIPFFNRCNVSFSCSWYYQTWYMISRGVSN